MKRLIILACCLLGLAGQLATAAERRVALVIGNNNYQNLPALQKAVNDANAVAAELKKIGFEVASYNDIGQKKMNQAINEFAQNVSGGGIGVFFYAGHGVQIDNQNYLIPVDMDSPKDAADVGDQAIRTSPIAIRPNSVERSDTVSRDRSQTPESSSSRFLAQWLASLARVLVVPKPAHTGRPVHCAMRCRMAWPRALRLR